MIKNKVLKRIVAFGFALVLASSGLAVLPRAVYADGEEGATSSDTTEVACSTAAQGLGWFVCTVLDLMAGALDGLYSLLVEKVLVVEIRLFSSESTSGTYKGWTYFRDLANIAFVIFFMVIVISQLTGYGIDNYGIKRSLPRLIVAAILVNLSFILCQIMVDLSNIVGSSITGLFDNLAKGITFPTEVGGVTLADGLSDAGGLVGGVVLIGAVGTGALLLAGGGAIGAGAVAALIGLLGAVLSGVIALLFMLLLLALRKGILVMGVVLSPIAFVCYILPNTKSIFDRWLKIMEGMLMLYPICGVVIGGGALASKIILSTGAGSADLWTVIISVLVQIGPYFFVPTLIQGAFKATGAIGARISRTGRMLGGRASGAVRNSRWSTINRQNIAENRQRAINATKVNQLARQKASIENKTLRKGMTTQALGALPEDATWGERREAKRVARREADRLTSLYNQDVERREKLQNDISRYENAGRLSEKDAERLTRAQGELAQVDRRLERISPQRMSALAENTAPMTLQQQYVMAKANAELASARGERLRVEDASRPGTYERITAAQDERRNLERDKEVRATLRVDTNNFDLDTTNRLLSELVHSSASSGSEESLSRTRVLMQELAATGPGKGQLARMLVDQDIDPEMRRFMAGEIQNNPSLAQAVKSKDAFALRYMSDINAGVTGAEVSFDAWLSQERVGGDGRPSGETNEQFVVRRDLSDDADLAKLSGEALRRAVSGMSLERLESITGARNYNALFSDADRRAIIEEIRNQMRSSERGSRGSNAAGNGDGSGEVRVPHDSPSGNNGGGNPPAGNGGRTNGAGAAPRNAAGGNNNGGANGGGNPGAGRP